MASMIRKPYCISHKGIIPHPGAKTQKFFKKRPSKEQITKNKATTCGPARQSPACRQAGLAAAGEEHAKKAIAAARRPPAAFHAPRDEAAEVHEVAASGTRIRPGIDIGQ